MLIALHAMGSGLSTVTWLADKVDEDIVRELARDIGTIAFDAEAFDLLADRNQEVGWRVEPASCTAPQTKLHLSEYISINNDESTRSAYTPLRNFDGG